MSKIKTLLECCCGILPDDKINAVRNDLKGIINPILHPCLPFNEIAGILHRKGLIMINVDGKKLKEFPNTRNNKLKIYIGDLNDGDGDYFKPYTNVVLKMKWKKADIKFFDVDVQLEEL